MEQGEYAGLPRGVGDCAVYEVFGLEFGGGEGVVGEGEGGSEGSEDADSCVLEHVSLPCFHLERETLSLICRVIAMLFMVGNRWIRVPRLSIS